MHWLDFWLFGCGRSTQESLDGLIKTKRTSEVDTNSYLCKQKQSFKNGFI